MRTPRMPVLTRVNDADLHVAAALPGLGVIRAPAHGVVQLSARGDRVGILPDHLPASMAVAPVAPDRPNLTPAVPPLR